MNTKQDIDSLLISTCNLGNFLNLDTNNDNTIQHTVMFMYEKFIRKPLKIPIFA